MAALELIISILLLLASLVLIVSVLMQSSKQSGIGAISGAAETFFGKNKARGLDAKLAKITKISAFVFVGLAIALMFVG